MGYFAAWAGTNSEKLFRKETEVQVMMNESRFTALAERNMDMVYRIALNAVGSAADAEDVTQNVMVRLYRADPDFESEEHAKRWLIRVAINESKRFMGLPWKKREASLEEVLNASAESDGLQRGLLREVAGLPPKYRVPMYLYYYEGYSVKEIAELTGRKVSTLQTRLARGREKLREVLEEEMK